MGDRLNWPQRDDEEDIDFRYPKPYLKGFELAKLHN
jgi:hypothetical protein